MKIILDTSFPIESSGGTAPSAFRIWKAGVNNTDHGEVLFTKESAQALLAEQTKRKNLYSIDYDHLSLKENRPATAGQAAGWHTLEVRSTSEGPELWATNVEWCPESKEGLESKPPKWRYFSPAYRLNEDNQVVSYVNTALCINPATWAVTQLATANAQIEQSQQTNQENSMEDMLKMLASMMDDPNQPEDVRAAAALLKEALLKQGGGEVEVVVEDKEAVAEEPKKEEKKMDTKTIKNKDSELQLATRIAELEHQLDQQKVDALVAEHVGKRIPKSLEKWARAQNMDTIKTYLASAPSLDSVKEEVEAPTRGKLTADSTSDEAKKIDQVLGLRTSTGKFGMDNKLVDGNYVVGFMTPSEARKSKLSK